MTADLLSHATEFAFHPEGASFGDKEVHYFTVTVSRRTAGKWAVLCMNQCWNKKTQSWEYESFPSSRTESSSGTPASRSMRHCRSHAPCPTG